MSLLLAIDWTASATTVSIIDAAARTKVGEGRCDHPDADCDPTVWWDALVGACRLATDTLEALGLPLDEVTMVMLGSNEPPGGLVALDAAGTPVHVGLTGNHAESAADAGWLLSHVEGGETAWVDATGTTPTAGSTVALLSWLHRSAPDAWAALRRVTLPIGYLAERLGAGAVLSPHTAIGTAVVDRTDPQLWRLDLLSVVDAELDWEAVLPRIVLAADPVGVLAPDIAARLGIPSGLPLHVGDVVPV